MIRLSVLMPGVPRRLIGGMPPSLASLFSQVDGRDDVEVLYFLDNKKRRIGDKRTDLLRLARGEYVSVVDDDDEISADYVEQLIAATSSNADVIVFPIRVTIDGAMEGVVEASIHEKVQEAYKAGEVTRRRPHQLACWRRDKVCGIAFPSTNIGEDYVWGDVACARVSTEHRIDKVLYHYKFASGVSEVL